MKNNLDIFKNLSLISYVAISMVIPIFGGLFLGRFLDRQLGTGPFLLILGIFLGIAAGYRNVYYVLMKTNRKGSKK